VSTNVSKREINPPVTLDFVAPTQQELEAKALRYLKTCKPKELKELKRNGELEQSLQLRARAAKRYALNLMESGVWETEAWNRAIRLEILESDSD
jgi:hypothetical protein